MELVPGKQFAAIAADGIVVTLTPETPEIGTGLRLELRRGDVRIVRLTGQAILADEPMLALLLQNMHVDLLRAEHSASA